MAQPIVLKKKKKKKKTHPLGIHELAIVQTAGILREESSANVANVKRDLQSLCPTIARAA